MGLLAEIFSNIFSKNKTNIFDHKSHYIFYKIVDSFESKEYALQCINTNAVFRAKLPDIVFDVDILYGLHPIQACYIGIEYAKFIKKINRPQDVTKIQTSNFKNYSMSRYGNYNLCYQNRAGDLSFINIKTNEEFVMDPRDIALTEELISEFDAAQAFYIGLTAGIKINNPTKIAKRVQLQIVK